MPGAVAPFPTPIDALSDHQVETALLGIAGHIAAAQCRFLQFPAEFDARKLWAVCDGVTSCAHRVSWKIGMNIRTANEHLRTARTLRNLPLITQAFAADELTYSTVRAISRVISDDTSTLERIAARRADALMALVTGHTGDGKVVERGNAEVIIHVDASTGTARLDGGPTLAPATAQRLLCDAAVQLLLDDRSGNRMHLGRSRRLATDTQIRALKARDGQRCQFPGCPHTRYLNAHHIIPWEQGGPTDLDNLIMIWTYHHTVVHNHDYRIHRVNGRWEFRRPDGTPVPEAAEPFTGKAESLVEMNTRAGLHINHTTIRTKWDGDSLDIDYILGLLLLPKRIPAAA